MWNDWVYEDFDLEDAAFINARFASGAAAHITHSLCGYDLLFDLRLIGTGICTRALHKERLASKVGVGDGRSSGQSVTFQKSMPSDVKPSVGVVQRTRRMNQAFGPGFPRYNGGLRIERFATDG